MGLSLKTLIILLLIMTVSGCSPKHDGFSEQPSTGITPNPNPDPLLKAAAENILGPKCVSCHGENGNNATFLGSTASPNLDALGENTRYVSIGQSELSSLYRRSSDGSMPPGNPLTEAEADDIKAWIDDLGIGESNEDPLPNDPVLASSKFSDIETYLLQPKCYGCHATNGKPYSSYSDLFPYFVTPDFPNTSKLFQELQTVTAKHLEREPISQSEIDFVEQWILNGAPND